MKLIKQSLIKDNAKKIFALMLCLLLPTAVIAEEKKLLLWQDFSVSGLYGGGFEVDPPDQGTFTLEHASGWSFGDMFMFLDWTHFNEDTFDGDDDAWYGEIGPRLSFNKIFNKNISFSIFQQDIVVFKDVLFAAQWERGEDKDATESILLGAGFDFDLSALGFIGLNKLKYFQFNIYARSDLHAADDGFEDFQITIVTAFPFQIGKAKFLLDGFMDYVAGYGPQASNLHLNPQLKLDVGNFYGHSDKFFIGIELDYWSNKFGIEDSPFFDTDQVAISGIVKYHF